MEKQNIRIKLRAYDNNILDASTEEIVNTVDTIDVEIIGVIPPVVKPSFFPFSQIGLPSLDLTKTLAK